MQFIGFVIVLMSRKLGRVRVCAKLPKRGERVVDLAFGQLVLSSVAGRRISNGLKPKGQNIKFL